MGNNSSTNTNEPKKFNNMYHVIDYIASYYILTMDFKSLINLNNKEYCDKLIILTSNIIENEFTELDVLYLNQRLEKDKVVNKMSVDKLKIINEDKLNKILNKDTNTDTNTTTKPKISNLKKKRMCNGIAKFYIKIAHIFAAIVKTINPIYNYKDSDGNIIEFDLLNKDKIPKNTKRTIHKINICDNRIRSLKNDLNVNKDNSVDLNPNVCNINIDKGVLKNLSDEPGISELMQLYLDDNYDYDTGEFKGMNENTKSIFLHDLKRFYTAFTGNKDMPDNIKQFSDIKLRDYRKVPECKNNSFNNKNKPNNDIFKLYADNINEMIQEAVNNQNKLLQIINELFTYVTDPKTKNKKIIINPYLTDNSLTNIIVKARKYIINLYINCEERYINGLKIYESIVETKILETTQNQIQYFENEKKNIMDNIKKEDSTNVVEDSTNYTFEHLKRRPNPDIF